MADAFEDFPDCVGMNAIAMLCGALTDEEIISWVRNTKPVAACDGVEIEDAAPVRPVDIVRPYYIYYTVLYRAAVP